MDRKNRVWLIVLAVLLIAAIAGMVVIRNQLSAREAEYASVNSRLTTEQASSAALKEELDAAQAQAAQLQLELEASAAESAQRASDLAAARETISALEAQVDAQSASPTDAPTEVPTEAPTAQPTEVPTDAPASASSIILNAALNSAKTASADLRAALETETINLDEVSLCAESLKAAVAALESQVAAAGSESLSEAVEVVRQKNETIAPLASKELSDEEKLLSIVTGEMSEAVESLELALNDVDAILSGRAVAPQSESEAVLESTPQPTPLPSAEPTAEETISADALSDLENQLADAESAVSELEGQLSDSSAQVADLTAQLEALDAQTEADASAIADLEARLADAQGEVESLKSALETARAEYERRLAELEAYRLSRTLTDGDAHASTAASSLILVAADGVTGEWSYVNQTLSGNAVVLTLVLDGEEIYRSEALQPGDSIETVTLSRALSAGEYEAIAVAAIYDADGSCLFASRTPVALTVAAQ